MASEYEFFSKDYIKFYVLNETVNSKTVTFKLFLESDGTEKEFLDVRASGRNVYRFNNFNVSEDVTNNCITFRPNVVGCYVYFLISSQNPIKVEIIKNGTNTVAQAFELGKGESKIEFRPNGTRKYDLKITNAQADAGVPQTTGDVIRREPAEEQMLNPFDTDFNALSPFDNSRSATSHRAQNESFRNASQTDFGGFDSFMTEPSQSAYANTMETEASSEEIREKERAVDQMERSNSILENDIAELENRARELERKNRELIDRKKSLTSHLDRLQEEFDKEYSNYNSDVEEISSRYHIDAEILKLYADKEVTPIEELLRRAEDDMRQIEEQIRVFVEAQERKTAEIENELKIGKKD